VIFSIGNHIWKKSGDREVEGFWGYFDKITYQIGKLTCYSLWIKGFVHIHWHIGISKENPKEWPWFRLRSLELFGNKRNKWRGITIPFLRYYPC